MAHASSISRTLDLTRARIIGEDLLERRVSYTTKLEQNPHKKQRAIDEFHAKCEGRPISGGTVLHVELWIQGSFAAVKVQKWYTISAGKQSQDDEDAFQPSQDQCQICPKVHLPCDPVYGAMADIHLRGLYAAAKARC